MELPLVTITREALLVLLAVSAPPLGAALLVGIASGVLQAATQVQEQSLTTVPRLAAVLAALALAGPWIGARVVRFTAVCLDAAGRIAP
jgi:flagellar biosynthesis protein FliQ